MRQREYDSGEGDHEVVGEAVQETPAENVGKLLAARGFVPPFRLLA